MSGVSGSRPSGQESPATGVVQAAGAAAGIVAGAAAGAGAAVAAAAAAAGAQTRDTTETQTRGSAPASASLFGDAADALNNAARQVGEAVNNVIQELQKASPPPPPNVINDKILEVVEKLKQQSRQNGNNENDFFRGAAEAIENAARDIGRLANPSNENHSIGDAIRRALEDVKRNLNQNPPAPEPPPVGDFPTPDPNRRYA